MAFQNPSIANFQAQFIRDFQYGTNIDENVLDADIALAFQLTNMNINQGLFADQASYGIAYNLLSAHYLVLNIRASSQGLNGQYNWIQTSKGAGPVNEAFSIPQWILDNPLMSQLTKTNYGSMYLQLILPSLCGAMFTAYMPARAL